MSGHLTYDQEVVGSQITYVLAYLLTRKWLCECLHTVWYHMAGDTL